MDIKGQLCYGCNQHFHYVSKPDIWTAYNGEKVVHSTLMEMLSNVSFSNRGGPTSQYTSSSPCYHVGVIALKPLEPRMGRTRRDESNRLSFSKHI